MKNILEDLSDSGHDLENLGFDSEDLQGVLDEIAKQNAFDERESVEDTTPKIPENKVSNKGDLWALGKHRLVCGDCRDAELFKTLVGKRKINLAISSPPYASQRKYDGESRFEPIREEEYVRWFKKVQSSIFETLAEDGSWFLNIKEHCADGVRVLYVKDLVLAHVRDWGWKFVDEFCWTKPGVPKKPKGRFKNQWEPVFQFTRGEKHKFRPESVMNKTDNKLDVPEGVKHFGKEWIQGDKSRREKIERTYFTGLAYPGNCLSLGHNMEALGHSAAFPRKLSDFFILAYTDEGDLVYDPFLGSGTTLISAESLGRTCFGFEISPAYCDVIVERWQNFTGQKAKRV